MVLLSPKTRYDLFKILPYGIIFVLTGLIFLMTEAIARRNTNLKPESDIELTIEVLLFAILAIFIFGLLIGLLEVRVLRNLFQEKSLARKIFYKLLVYTLAFLIVITITYPIAAALELGLSILHPIVLNKFYGFLFSITFYNSIFQLAFSLFVCLIYAGITENIGQSVFLNLISGRYHKAKVEQRVFMFLDMKSSTSIAEKLGHLRYFGLLREFYEGFSIPIIEHEGEVYQYIGDEIVISWPIERGIRNLNCIKCHFAMKQVLELNRTKYEKEFGVFPDFKSGLHLGEVTTGEIGALKKEIFFTGDVLNTTSRIQNLCKDLKKDLLISEQLLIKLKLDDQFTSESLGAQILKGRTEPIHVLTLYEK